MRAPLLLAILLAPVAAAADVQVRLTPEATAGGAWGSAIFIGDGDSAGFQSHITPGLAADVSFSPVLKVLSGYRFTWNRYENGGSSLFHDAGLTVRLRVSRAFDVDLVGAFDRVTLDGLNPGDAARPPAITAMGVDGGPLVRWRLAERTTAEGAVVAGTRSNDLGDGQNVGEDWQQGTLALTHRFAPNVEASLRYRHLRSRADVSLWSYDGDGAQVQIAWVPAWELLLRAHAGGMLNRFDDRSDRYVYAGASASLPVAPSTTAELAWSYGNNTIVHAADVFTSWPGIEGSRHMLWSGVRVELPWWL